MQEICASLLLPFDGSDREFGNSFLKLLRQTGHNIAPSKCGVTEPVKAKCAHMTTEDITADFWGESFLWTGVNPRFHGFCDVFRGRTGVFIYGSFSVDAVSECISLFKAIAMKWPIDFGFIHVLADEEWEHYKSAANRLLDPFNRGITERDLAGGIPNLGWITLFGAPYRPKIDREIVARAAALTWAPSDAADSALMIQLTDDPCDVAAKFQLFEAIRQRAREAIGSELFKCVGDDATWVPETFKASPVTSVFADLKKLNRHRT